MNMEYCRFRNTEIDLGDCVKGMKEAYSVTWLDEAELSSLIRMRRLCKQFLEESERLLEDGRWKKIAEGMGDDEEIDSQLQWESLRK